MADKPPAPPGQSKTVPAGKAVPAGKGVALSSRLRTMARQNTTVAPAATLPSRPLATAATTTSQTTGQATDQGQPIPTARRSLFRALAPAPPPPLQATETATAKPTETATAKPKEKAVTVTTTVAEDLIAPKPKSSTKPAPPPPLKSLAPAAQPPKKYKKADCKTPDGQPQPIDPELIPYSEALQESVGETHYKIKELKPFKVSNRFFFSRFIPTMYKKFKIKEIPKSDPEACKKMTFQQNKYQEFIREYFRLDSPTRGALVYHGLGSGKTCSAIAAAEALFSESGRKIIVMTPVSLRANFIREIKFCGFKIYRTQNHWVPLSLYKDEDEEDFDWTVYCFAKSVLHLPVGYIDTVLGSTAAKVIWVPDMSEGKESNFHTFNQKTKRQITAQIDAMIQNSITFLGYNGLTEKKLKHYATEDPTFFDNKTIIIDEVHNLTSLMRGRLAKYLEKPEPKAGKPSRAAPSVYYDPLTVEPWSLKEGKERKYDRAYLLYRLLSEARHSKIIALSGTPIVNYPEELGILGNLLHGNFHSASFRVDSQDTEAIKHALDANPYVDFTSVEKTGTNSNVYFTLLEPGFRKEYDTEGESTGVVYEGPSTPSIAAVADQVRAQLPVRGEITYSATPLFPLSKAKFNDLYVNKERIRIKNSLVFLKRMSGLISYYKGGRKDYMPSINKDVILEIPMSDHMLGSYLEARRKERDVEESLKKVKKKPEGDGAAQGQTVASSSVNWGVISGVPNDSQGKDTASSSYRFRSRALCNFAFPRDIPRPFPRDSKEAEEAAALDVPVYGDEDDNEPGAPIEVPVEEATEIQEAAAQDAQEVAEAVAEEAADDPSILTLRQEAEAALKATADDGIMGDLSEDERALFAGLPYEIRIARTLEKLRARAPRLFRTDDAAPVAEQLAYYSPKFAKMYENIEAAPGSSLVYSQFKTLEGLGIFGIALEANGYARVRLERKEGNKVVFAPETLASIKANPTQRRYTVFSGDPQDAEFRKELVDIFNMNIEEPIYSEVRKVLIEAGLYDAERKVGNQAGEFCRIFMITGAGSEGISLKNVRAVHLMEPHWNKVRMDQVKGRAVRICSHKDLPVDQRNVDIYTYLTVMTEEQLRRNQEIVLQDFGETSDQYIYNVAYRKNRLNMDFLEAIQMGAVDCELNKIENGIARCFERDASVDNYLYDPRIDYDVPYTQQYFNRKTEIQRRIVKSVPQSVVDELFSEEVGEISDDLAYMDERMGGRLGEDYNLIYTEMISGKGKTYYGVFSDAELTHPTPYDRERQLGRLDAEVDADGRLIINGILLKQRPAAAVSAPAPLVERETMEEAVLERVEDGEEGPNPGEDEAPEGEVPV